MALQNLQSALSIFAGNQPSNPSAVPKFLLILSVSFLALTGCKSFHLEHHEYVYVAARQVYLHDRVAAVSNRVGQVTNGQALEVVERGKRFTKVKTPKGEIGWLEDHAIIDDKLYAQFQELSKKHMQDMVVATAELRDDLYLHLQPGRESAHFLLIPGSAKVQLIERGTVEKAAPPGTPAAPKLKPPVPSPTTAGTKTQPAGNSKIQAAASASPASAPSVVPVAMPVPMEDWWLVRDSQGHTGWLLAGRLDVDVPEDVGGYAEGQRMVGAYPIAKVTDWNAGQGHKSEINQKAGSPSKKPSSPDAEPVGDASSNSPASKEFTEYVTLLTPPRSGLPYDFDQLRVFVWSLNHHRYETAYRLHGIQGYFPLKMSKEMVNGESEPVFTFDIANGGNVSIDADTGVTRPVAPRTLSFRLEGNQVKRTGADQAPIILTHESTNPNRKKSGKKKR